MEPLHRAGTEIRDKAGALVATLTRDVYAHDNVHSSDFLMADGSYPAAGTLIPRAIADFMKPATETA